MAEANCRYLTECPICLERLFPPVDTCIKGHAVCKECRRKVEICPTCRGEFSTNQNVLLNQMLETIPQNCKYRQSGCRRKMILKVIVEHEKDCYYRSESCCLCGKNGIPFCRLNEHFQVHSGGWQNLYQTFRIDLYVSERGSYTYVIYFDQSTNENIDESAFFYEMRIDQKLPFKGPRALFTYTGFCMPYYYSDFDWKAHKRAVTLDLDKIFLCDEIPQMFTITFQIREVQ